jgi:hypothetical protein
MIDAVDLPRWNFPHRRAIRAFPLQEIFQRIPGVGLSPGIFVVELVPFGVETEI